MSDAASETQQSICAWAEETFDPAKSAATLHARALPEMEELADALRTGDRQEVAHELADIVILLYRVAQESGVDLHTAIDEKMAINRARQWVPADDGTGQHVK
ncbi:MazG-like family protein [Parvibaculum sp. MBR-TMA-1.3b-4.2]|jgi:NTP pyrophosphatase (non-canonical NTP hydrolase)